MKVSLQGSIAAVAASAVLIESVAAALPRPVSKGLPQAPQIWPQPQEQKLRSDGFKVPTSAVLIAGNSTDQPALRVLQQVLKDAGVTRFLESSDDSDDALRVYVGGPSENNASASALNALGLQGPGNLTAEGYVLGIGRDAKHHPVVVLSGHDQDGTFYAAQTLRQLVASQKGNVTLPGLAIRDWPSIPIRGTIEVFYGIPWSLEDRLDQLDFYAATKQNTYIYSPKDDPLLREQWRDPYVADALADLKTLVDRSTENHVDFTFAVSPGLSICYSSEADEQALLDKFQSLWDLGARAFNIPFDDISYTEWNCPEDEARWGTGGDAAGHAQSYLLNRVQANFIDTHPGAARLQMVSTEYKNTTDTPYRAALREALDPRVIVFWSGPVTVANNITANDALGAEKVFGHDILIGDNYPVNDYTYQRLLVGPYNGREPNMTNYIVGLTVNPMPMAQPSKIGEWGSGMFTWNSAAYDADAAWLAALKYLGGSAWKALKVLAENNYSSVMNVEEALVLAPLINDFWKSYNATRHGSAKSADALSKYFGVMASTPKELEDGMGNAAFVSQVQPWLKKLGLYGEAGQTAVKMLLAQQAGQEAKVRQERLVFDRIRGQLDNITSTACPLGVCRSFQPIVAPGVMEEFLNSTLDATTGR